MQSARRCGMRIMRWAKQGSRLRASGRTASRMVAAKHGYAQRPLGNMKLLNGLGLDQQGSVQRSGRRIGKELADRTSLRIVWDRLRNRWTLLRIRPLGIRATSCVPSSTAVTTIPSGIGRACRHTLPSMQTRTPLERNQMRGEHQPEHRILCQFPHRSQNYKGGSQCERPPDHSSKDSSTHYSPPGCKSQYSKSLRIADFHQTGRICPIFPKGRADW